MIMTRMIPIICGVVAGTLLGSTVSAADPVRKTKNVIVVTLDGFRWQELFGGADESFMDSRQGGVRDINSLKARYLRKTADERRETLMPFLWTTIAKKGQIFGNPGKNAAAKITNPLKFSYPGYSELFCGLVDPRIDSNGKKNNPNLSVFEFLNTRPGFQGRVEAVCTWDVFPYILRSQQNGLRVHSGWSPIQAESLTADERAVNDNLAMLPQYWPGNSFDVIATGVTKTVIQRRKPRVLYIGLGETDEWGHGRRYDLYLNAAHNADQFLASLWDGLQKDPQYQNQTSLIITTDHGRGSTRADWTDHGKNVAGAEFIWVAVMGPDTPALGERENVQVTQSQVAATIAAFLGEDFQKASPQSAAPLPVFASK